MTDGPRLRGNASADGDTLSSESTEEGSGRVALKKEIGLVSACGIIVGKSLLCSSVLAI